MYTFAVDGADSFMVIVEVSALLSAVRWSVAGALDPAFARVARRTGEFLPSLENKAVELNRPVSDFRHLWQRVRVQATGPSLKALLHAPLASSE